MGSEERERHEEDRTESSPGNEERERHEEDRTQSTPRGKRQT
jgi:hypothetical protein